MHIEIAITAQGPVVRTAARSLELEAADEITARCNRLTLEARERLELRAKTLVQQASEALRSEAPAIDIQATASDVRISANDDVQLLGDKVLLNCEREAGLPSWLPTAPPRHASWNFVLAEEVPQMFLQMPGEQPISLEPRIRTLLIEPELDRVCVVWVGEHHAPTPVGPGKAAQIRYAARFS